LGQINAQRGVTLGQQHCGLCNIVSIANNPKQGRASQRMSTSPKDDTPLIQIMRAPPQPKPLCLHDKFAYQWINPDVDGLGEVKQVIVRCSSCNKHLATEYYCISADWRELHDRDWGIRHNIREGTIY
jgi:hypothetical protein